MDVAWPVASGNGGSRMLVLLPRTAARVRTGRIGNAPRAVLPAFPAVRSGGDGSLIQGDDRAPPPSPSRSNTRTDWKCALARTLMLPQPLPQTSRPPVNRDEVFKTEICARWVSGLCQFGDQCQFAHGAHELKARPRPQKYKTELCRSSLQMGGNCPYGQRCHFIHAFSMPETPLTLAQHGKDAVTAMQAGSPEMHGAPATPDSPGLAHANELAAAALAAVAECTAQPSAAARTSAPQRDSPHTDIALLGRGHGGVGGDFQMALLAQRSRVALRSTPQARAIV